MSFIQAFSGIKRTETQRQQKEARLQGISLSLPTDLPNQIFSDLVELFGIRNREDRET